MCGIVGYTGERQAVNVLLDGLAQLEYRGYDSTGICLAGPDGFTRLRADDNLAALRALVDEAPETPAPAGIGHTRWATHGEVSVANTHPFVGCDTGFAVVLNGIIENFSELRDELAGRGHRFESADRRRGRGPSPRGARPPRARGRHGPGPAASTATSPSSPSTAAAPGS